MPELGELVKITLDKERLLRLTLKGMLEFEKLTKRNLLKGFDPKKLSLEDTAALIWACLIHEDKDLTYDDVLCMVDLSNLVAVTDAVSICLERSLPEGKPGERPLGKKSPPG